MVPVFGATAVSTLEYTPPVISERTQVRTFNPPLCSNGGIGGSKTGSILSILTELIVLQKVIVDIKPLVVNNQDFCKKSLLWIFLVVYCWVFF